jgi:CDP-diacylglycerol pyrophosphatase
MAVCAHQAHQAQQAHKHESPNVLWHFVHDKCAPTAARGIYPPAPCIEVVDAHNPGRGYVVFKDRNGRYQYLVLPLTRITGIESPALLAPDAPNYLAAAWTARMYVEAALHKRMPRQDMSVSVNSMYGRSQNQLHIHVDCIRADVRDTLHRLLPDITRQWQTLPVRLPAHGYRRTYMARWVDGAALSLNPFHALAKALPAGDHMGLHSLVVVGARNAQGQPGFILLSTRADLKAGNNGNSDNLQDTTCAIAGSAAPH